MRGARAWRQPARPAPALSNTAVRFVSTPAPRRRRSPFAKAATASARPPARERFVCRSVATPPRPPARRDRPATSWAYEPPAAARSASVARIAGRAPTPAAPRAARAMPRAGCVSSRSCPGGCPTGSTCTNGVCVPSAPRALYADCTPSTTIASGCASNLCLSSGTSPGFCGLTCNSDDGDSVCGVGGVCWSDASRTLDRAQISGELNSAGLGQFATVGGRSAGVCVKKCGTSADCPAGATCAEWNGSRGCLFRSLPAAHAARHRNGCRGSALPRQQPVRLRVVRDRGRVRGRRLREGTGGGLPGYMIPGDGNICLVNCAAAADFPCPALKFATTRSRHPRSAPRGSVVAATLDCDVRLHLQNRRSGTCRNTPMLGSAAVGSPCTNGAGCAGDLCRTSAGGFPQGYCTAVCQFSRICRTPARRARSASGSPIHRYRFARRLLRPVRCVAERVEVRFVPHGLRVHRAADRSARRLLRAELAGSSRRSRDPG